MLYTIGEIFLRDIRYYITFSKKKLFEKNMNVQSFRTIRVAVWAFPLGSLGEK
jgi:hypothetical protein